MNEVKRIHMREYRSCKSSKLKIHMLIEVIFSVRETDIESIKKWPQSCQLM